VVGECIPEFLKRDGDLDAIGRLQKGKGGEVSDVLTIGLFHTLMSAYLGGVELDVGV